MKLSPTQLCVKGRECGRAPPQETGLQDNRANPQQTALGGDRIANHKVKRRQIASNKDRNHDRVGDSLMQLLGGVTRRMANENLVRRGRSNPLSQRQ
jgi:hypothetical protein